MKGQKTNNTLLDFVGIINSFNNNFNPSAKGCSIPQNPNELGPILR
jgi:hypothetical protein